MFPKFLINLNDSYYQNTFFYFELGPGMANRGGYPAPPMGGPGQMNRPGPGPMGGPQPRKIDPNQMPNPVSPLKLDNYNAKKIFLPNI